VVSSSKNTTSNSFGKSPALGKRLNRDFDEDRNEDVVDKDDLYFDDPDGNGKDDELDGDSNDDELDENGKGNENDENGKCETRNTFARYENRNMVKEKNQNDNVNQYIKKKNSDKQDLYETPDRVIDVIVQDVIDQYPAPYHRWTIFEPCAGNGAISNYFEKIGYYVIKRDLYTLPDEHDYLQLEEKDTPEYDVLITNPPFSLREEFIEKFEASNKPYIVILPIQALVEFNTSILFKSTVYLKLMSPAPTFKHNNKMVSLGNTAWFYGNFNSQYFNEWIVYRFPDIEIKSAKNKIGKNKQAAIQDDESNNKSNNEIHITLNPALIEDETKMDLPDNNIITQSIDETPSNSDEQSDNEEI